MSSEGGSCITLDGDAWRKAEINHLVISDIILQFDYESSVGGERHGIGVDNNNSPNSTWTFKLQGTQTIGRKESRSTIIIKPTIQKQALKSFNLSK